LEYKATQFSVPFYDALTLNASSFLFLLTLFLCDGGLGFTAGGISLGLDFV